MSPPATHSKQQSSQNQVWQLYVVVLIIIVGVAFIERLTRPTGGEAIDPKPMPKLQVEGWINTAAWEAAGAQGSPSVETLKGRWIVADCWATWCVPCLRALPELAEFNSRWDSRGVVVLGFTPEDGSQMEQIQAVVARTEGFDWPVAYGSNLILDQLSVSRYPTLILFDPEGRAVWRGYSIKALEGELEQRLSTRETVVSSLSDEINRRRLLAGT